LLALADSLDGLDLSVATGEVHGFLGPNGSGKSTTIRVLLGLLRADSGRAVLLGGDPWGDAVALHRRLAYVPGDVSLWPNLSGGETIDLLLRMRGIDPRGTRRDELLQRFELDPTKKGPACRKGNRQKVPTVPRFPPPGPAGAPPGHAPPRAARVPAGGGPRRPAARVRLRRTLE